MTQSSKAKGRAKMRKVRWLVGLLAVALLWGVSAQEAEKMIGQKAPDFVLADLKGETVRLSQFRGKVVVLVFFAFWCDTWKETAVRLKAVRRNLPSSSVQILGIAVDPTWKEMGLKAQRKGAFSFPVLLDRGGRVRKRYGITKVPTLLLIDANGFIRLGFLGCPRPEILSATAMQLVGQPPLREAMSTAVTKARKRNEQRTHLTTSETLTPPRSTRPRKADRQERHSN
jgi:peroxiredoxin